MTRCVASIGYGANGEMLEVTIRLIDTDWPPEIRKNKENRTRFVCPGFVTESDNGKSFICHPLNNLR